MEDSAKQPWTSHATSQVTSQPALPPSHSLPTKTAAMAGNDAPTVVHLSPAPLALGAVSGNVGAASAGVDTPKDAAPKPVFKMKRTGQPTLPPATIIPFGSAPNMPTPVTSHGGDDPDPTRVVSDIVPPQPLSTPITVPAVAHHRSTPASDGARKTKYATDEERRKATSLALKQRWASGRMDHVHRKRVETMRRKREAEALLGTAGVTKPAGTGAGLKQTPKSSASSNRLPGSLARAASPTRHGRKRSLMFEHLTRAFEDILAYADSASSTAPAEPSSTASDVEMWESSPPPSRHLSEGHEEPAHEAARKENDPEDLGRERGGKDWSSISGGSEAGEYGNRDGGGANGGTPPSTKIAVPRAHYGGPRDEPYFKRSPGALIPAGYQLSASTPGHPWICPIRSCRVVFKGIGELDVHFNTEHRGARLHDNVDGTFTQRSPDPSSGPLHHADTEPAYVISRGGALSAEPPPVPPSYPDSLHRARNAETDPIRRATANRQEDDKAAAAGGDKQALWRYLQPHLVKHKGPTIPAKGWVTELIALPRIRELDWNVLWLKTHPFTDTNPRDISALILQVTGDPAPKPCDKCREAKGPFNSCIMISSKAESGPLGAIVSCANCFYHFNQTYCSHKRWGAERSNRLLKARQGLAEDEGEGSDELLDGRFDEPFDEHVGEEGEDMNLDEENDVPSGEEHDEDAADADEDDVMEYTVDDSTAAPSQSLDSYENEITEAEPGRPYTMWPDKEGQLAPMFGALIPAGYQLDDTIPNRPWVCPVRTCRRALCKRSDVGYHFTRVHYAAILNDNCDGTLSVKGCYQSKKSGLGHGAKILIEAPPVVVSKEPLRSGSPVPKAQLPAYLAAKPQETAFEQPPPRPPRKRTTRIGREELWAYIQPHLAKTNKMPHSDTLHQLLELPRMRDLEFNPRSKGFNESGCRDIAAMLVQVTGEAVPNGCKRCRKGKGPFQGCVLMPRTAHKHAKMRYPSCANCIYGGKYRECTLMEWTMARDRPLPPLFPLSISVAELREAGGSFQKIRREREEAEMKQKAEHEAAFAIPPDTSGMPPRRESTRQSTRYAVESGFASDSVSTPFSNGVSTTPAARGPADDMPASTRDTTKPSTRHSVPSAVRSQPPAPSALVSRGTLHGQDNLLEMEDWEVAPGRIRETDAAEGDTIAFSKPYLSTAQAVPVCEDVSFRVSTIPAGNTLQLEADASQTRLCSVAAGKVRVQLSGEPEFVVGPHGLFKVKAGVACTVRNGLYLDAVVHTVVLVGYA